MGLFDFLFGGTDDSSQDLTLAANAADRDLFQRLAAQSRGDALSIFPSAQQAASQGIQGALDIFSQTIPQQASLIQQGNLGAQNILAGGLGGINAAILGLPQDLSQQALSQLAQPLNFNTDFATQNLSQVFNPSAQFIPQNTPLGQSQLPQGTPSGSRFPSNAGLPPNISRDLLSGFETPSNIEAPNINDLINDIFSSPLSVDEKALTVLQLAKDMGLSPEQLASQSFLTAADISQGQERTNFRL